tara:strand:+ start:5647 stop:6513 length:867 start_codon:yes stop_codon:yes gene_type:complete
MKNICRPILKWAGGKTFLRSRINDICKNIKITRYIEPFFGSGAIYFNLIDQKLINKRKSIINDANKELMNLYKHIRSSPDELVIAHKKIIEDFNNKGYYYVRSKFNGIDKKGCKVQRYKKIDKSAALMILNKTCFNGLYRVNKNNEFNVPEGKYTTPSFVSSQMILNVSKVLPSMRNISSRSFKDISYEKGDLIYLDPPYDPINKTSSFTSYSQEFGKDEQKQLCDKFNALDKIGANVILSNSSTDFIEKLYKGHTLETIDSSRSINSKKDKRGKVKELLIIGKNFGK